MRFEDKLSQTPPKELWDEYCGFLKLDVPSYMRIQNRLMEEQIQLFLDSPMGKQLSGTMGICTIPLWSLGFYR